MTHIEDDYQRPKVGCSQLIHAVANTFAICSMYVERLRSSAPFVFDGVTLLSTEMPVANLYFTPKKATLCF